MKMYNVKTKQERIELIQKLLQKDFEDLDYDNFAHILKIIDRKYCQNREKWAEKYEKLNYSQFPQNTMRLSYLSEDAKWAYVFGLYKATIMYSVLAAEQILKNIYLKHNSFSKEAYEKIEGTDKKKGCTLGGIIGLFKKNEILPEKKDCIINCSNRINDIRNKTSGHLRFTGKLNRNLDYFINYLNDLRNSFKEVRKLFDQEFYDSKAINQLINDKDKKLIQYGASIEYKIEETLAKETLNNLFLIVKNLDGNLID